MTTLQQRPLSDMCVLIADDNVDGADSLAALLDIELQCRLLVAYDGAGALRQAYEHQPDAMVLDIRMPGLDGIEVARQMRAAGGRRPLLLAATGQADIADDLAEIDSLFDQAYAKPVDADQIIDALKRHWLGGPAPIATPPFELSELFARTARDVARVVKGRHQLSFDYRGPFAVLSGDQASLHAALYRLPCAVADMMRTGFLIFSADVQAEADGSCLVTVNAAGTGDPISPQRASEIVSRLGLVEQTGDDPAAHRATGICPNSHGRVEFASRPSDGVLLRLEWRCTPMRVDDARVDAHGGLAWIVDEDEVGSVLLERRLVRLGWQVQRYGSCTDASIAYAAEPRPRAPRLVVVHQGARNTVQRAIVLQRELPQHARLLFEVAPGATNVEHAEAAGCEVRIAPLSPRELHELTLAGSAAAADTRTAPLAIDVGGERKPVVLVVDDNRVNRVVASGLVEALGYDSVAVGDGLDAIEHCKRSPPSVVLMDINMPVLGGVDAARRIRELQVLGRIAPFPIVAATADADPEVEAGCLAAGMDGFLAKPLRLAALAHELRRVAPATARA